MNTILTLINSKELLPLLFYLAFTLLLVLLTNKPFGKLIPFSFIIPTFIVYLTGLNEKVSLGINISIYLLVFIIPLLVIRIKDIKDIIKNYFTFAFLIFIIFYFLVLYYHKYSTLNSIDEYAHWGLMVKELFRLDKLYCVNESKLLVHKDYPPFLPIINYFFSKLNGGFIEANLFKGCSLFTLSLLLPISEEKNKYKYTIAPLALIFSILLQFVSLRDSLGSNVLFTNLLNILADYPVAILGALTCFKAFNLKQDDHIEKLGLTILLTSLLFIKQIGICFFGLAFLFYLFNFIFKKDNFKIINIITSLIIFIIPFIVLNSYNAYASNFELNIEFALNEQLSFTKIKEFFIDKKGLEYQFITLNNFIDAIKIYPIFYNLNITYIPFNIILSIIIGLGLYIYDQDIKKSIIYALIYLFGSFAYAFTMLILYCFSFDQYFATEIFCYLRYMNTYNYFGLALLIIISLLNLNKNKFSYLYLVIISSFLIYTSLPSEEFKNPKQELSFVYNNYPKTLEVKESLNKLVEKGSKVLIVEPNVFDDRSINNILNYELDDYYFNQLVNNKISDFTAIFEYDLEYEDFLELIKDFDYMYIYDYDEYFYNVFNRFFEENGELLQIHRLYKLVDNKPVFIE